MMEKPSSKTLIWGAILLAIPNTKSTSKMVIKTGAESLMAIKRTLLESTIKKSIKAENPVCIFGRDEDGTVQKSFKDEGIRVELLPGTHHYNSDFNAVGEIIRKDFVSGPRK